MIHYLTRKELITEKYDACISNAVNSKIYAYSWYLDIVADNWDALVLNDYEAVMPLPWRKKYFIKYVYTPFWLLELGIFYKSNTIDETIFLEQANKYFKFIELRMNAGNILGKRKPMQFQYLLLKDTYENIKLNFRKDRKKDLLKAAKNNLTEQWNDDPKKLIHLFRQNVGNRAPNIKDADYKVLLYLVKEHIKRNTGEVISIYTNTRLVASAFLLKHKNTITILVSSTDFKNRKNGANTFLIDRAIYKYYKDFSIFNFGGSSISSIASYFKSFNALNAAYYMLKQNNLPQILRLFKK